MKQLKELLPFKYTLSPEEKITFKQDIKLHQGLLRKYNIRVGDNCEYIPMEQISATQDFSPDYKIGEQIWVVCVPALIESLTNPATYGVTYNLLDKHLPELIRKAQDWGLRNSKTTINQLDGWWGKYLFTMKQQEEANATL